jgi:hypothetical protein
LIVLSYVRDAVEAFGEWLKAQLTSFFAPIPEDD